MIKTFPLRITKDFHAEMKEAAHEEHLSIHEFIVKAITERILQQGKK